MLHNPVYVELFDKDDRIIGPVTRPISITQNFEAHDTHYVAVQVETFDSVMREVLKRYHAGELIQYRISGRFGVDTGDINSIYAYDEKGSGEFSFYGRSHKDIFRQVLGFPQPTNDNPDTQTATHKAYSGSALKVARDVLTDNLVNRIGQDVWFQSGDVGNNISVEFRFDLIYDHLYSDSEEKGGALLVENGNIIFEVTRNFALHRFEVRAYEPTHHDRTIEVKSGLVGRWQFTANRAEANRVIVGGPGELLDRHFVDVKGTLKHRHFPSEAFTENTNPDIPGLAEGQDPTEAQIKDAMQKFGLAKLREYAEKAGMVAQLVESDNFYFGEHFRLGDWVNIGVDADLLLGEQQLDKIIVTWTRANGYMVTLTPPPERETNETSVLRTIMKAIREMATRTRRR